MSLFGFGSQKNQKSKQAKKAKKSKPREIWQGKSHGLDDIISPSVLVGGGEHSPEPFLVDIPPVSGSEFDLIQSDLLQALEAGNLDALLQAPDDSLFDHQIIIDWLNDPSSQPLSFFDNSVTSTNSLPESTSILHSSNSCSVENNESFSGKLLPGNTNFSGATRPTIPLTNVDTGGNNLANPTSLVVSNIKDVIDQVSHIDPTDIYRVKINDLKNADISVLSGQISVDYLMPSGQFLGSQFFSTGNHTLLPPADIKGDVIVKINYQGGTPGTYILNGFETKNHSEPFNIDLEFGGGLSASQQAIIQAAAKSVESMISQGLPTAIVDGKLIDDVNFKVSATNLDGAGGTAARTKIDFMRFGTMLPAQSITQFDAADIAELESSGELFSVVQHELLHGLGFGNLWEAKGLVDYAGTPLAQYNGQEAVKAFQELGGLTSHINLENNGNGSAGLHWNENIFQDEVMTADYNNGKDGNAPISLVTIASLADLGYQVNLNRATPDYGLFGGQKFNTNDLTPEELEAFRELAETSFTNSDEEFIYATMPEVDPDTVAPEIWAHAEQFWKNKEYYDWVSYQIRRGDTLSQIAFDTMGSYHPDYYWWIANHNGIPDPNYIVTGNWIEIPKHHPNYEWEQEQERLRREADLAAAQAAEAQRLKDAEDKLANDLAEQAKLAEDQRLRDAEAQAQAQALQVQANRLAEELKKKHQHDELLKEQARLAELVRQAEIARQQGKGGLDWYLAKSLPEFGPVDPFETKLTGETVGNLVPDDYYRFTLSRSGRITAELRQLLADADLVLYDVRNHPISYSMRDGITDEHLIADLIPGTYLIRVNSPKGVTTDYELIVKFKHLLSQTEIGPPPGWKPGGSGNSGTGGGGTGGSIFADPRIKQIYDTALNNFATPERANANARIQQLQLDKQSYEQELQQLLDQMNGEQRANVHGALDDVRHNGNVWADDTANLIKGTIDNIANGIINQIDNKIPGSVYNIPGIGDALRNGKDALKGTINGAKDWLKEKVAWVQDRVKHYLWHFIEAIKNAYRTGGEINSIIEQAASDMKRGIDGVVSSINNLVEDFKGKVLGGLDWLKNVGAFGWNFYDGVVAPLANSVANGVKDEVKSVGNFANGAVDWIKPRAQTAVAAVVDAIFGDKTGNLYNKIQGVDKQIAATRTELENKIINKASELKNQLQALLNKLGSEGKKILDTILDFANSPIGQVSIEVLKVALGFVPIVGQTIDVIDTLAALWKVVIDGRRDTDVWVELIGSLAGWFPGVGDAIKGIAKIALKGPIGTLLRKLGPDVTKQAAKIFKEANWKAILADVVEGIAGVWRKFDSQMDSAAGWILDLMPGIRPTLAAVGEIVVKFNDEAADAGKQLDNISKTIANKIDDTSEQIAKEDKKDEDPLLMLPGPDPNTPKLPSKRLEELSVDPQTGKPNQKSQEEAESILQAEMEGLVKGAIRPDLSKGEPNLDFKIDGGYAEVKTPILPTYQPILEQAKNIALKSNQYDSDVMVIVDLKNLDAAQKIQFKLELENQGTDRKNIRFLNDK
ncbi:hypothetical protein [Anabaena sp. UHCC 0187]|uniref:hypothetical protein n=1 Tax=Anabaena sp. UHCC 0187 TaxID=2590018 RepID=UPI0015804C32|nr:hypothetical protein [Anabaena sp. UHCC 0187]